MTNHRKTAREALETAYREHGDNATNKFELFAYADGLPDEIDEAEAISMAADVMADAPEPKQPNTPVRRWDEACFADANPGVYPPEMAEYDGWMVHKGDKLPYAPWTDHDAPAPCSNHNDHRTTAECDHSARYKWGWEPNRRPFDDAQMLLDDPQVEGLVFIQTEADPFVFVDGDDVRDPETGDVHPAFIALLNHFGLTYADLSVSGSGVHAIYRGDLPADESVATWQIDSKPWGSNNEKPVIEIYSGKHVNVTTGQHVDGAPEEVRPWGAEVAHTIVEANITTNTTPRQELREARQRAEVGGGDARQGTDASECIKELNRLSAAAVAEKTIVDEWTDESGAGRGFLPTWGSSDDGGTANFVDETCWVDTGKNGGRGGPIEMALIHLGELRNENAQIGCASGSDFWTGYEHLRDLGFRLPEPPYTDGQEETAASDYYDADLGDYTDGDPWSDPDAMLEACLAARADGEVPEGAEPPSLALTPIVRDLLGVDNPSEATKEAAVEVFHEELTVDSFTDGEVLL